jgi:mono/diheme cytochrome c family protein
MRHWIVWSGALVLVGALGVLMFVRGSGISSDRTPWPLEERLARAGWRFLVPRDVRDAANPTADSQAILRDGLEHFADHCAVCHGNNGNGDTVIGRRTFPPAPDLRAPRTQGLSDGELFYAIEQGIPWTAMPAWKTGTAEGELESWKLVRFIRHLPALTPAEITDMERLNPKSAADQARDREIEEFLKGSGTAIPKKGGHIHK